MPPSTELDCVVDGKCRCAASDLFELLGRKYALDILCVIANHETARFGDIEDHIPEASTTTVSSRLDELAAAGLVDRERYDEIPPRVEYGLTRTGRDLAEQLAPVARFATNFETP